MVATPQFESRLAASEGTIRAEGYIADEQGESLARKRYQRGTLILKEKRDEHDRIDKERSFWIGRWREDEIRGEKVHRARTWQELGSLASLPSRRLALRELEKQIASINDPGYRARPIATFAEFAKRWESIVLVQHKPSTQATVRSHIKKYLVPFFGNLEFRDMRSENIQEFIAGVKASPKTVRNIFITMQLMWKLARSWQYVFHNVLDGVVLLKTKDGSHFFPYARGNMQDRESGQRALPHVLLAGGRDWNASR